MEVDERYMRRAIELAGRGWGQVSPNPMVGAVVVSDGVIVGEGHHARFGAEHAEVIALRQAGPRAAGSTLYVNLEPCAHTGKTSACVPAIGAAGVREVVVACRDPNPLAAGGLEQLEAAGVHVRVGTLDKEAWQLNAPFFWRVTQELPFVALKLAMSIDGRIAAKPGARTAVTGAEAQEEVHRLRSGYDAILVGRGTAVTDDPLLTVRDSVLPRVPPVRVVLDSQLEISSSSRLVATAADTPVCVVGVEGASADRRERLTAAGVQVLLVEASDDSPDIRSALAALREAGIGTVLVEGGAQVASALLREELVQRLYLLIAPTFYGDGGLPAFFELPASAPDDWAVSGRAGLGRDTLIVYEKRDAMVSIERGDA